MNWFEVQYDAGEEVLSVLLLAADVVSALKEFHYKFAEIALSDIESVVKTDYVVCHPEPPEMDGQSALLN